VKIKDNIRSQFPVLSQMINGHPLAFLDSSATTQKPLCVVDAMSDFYKTHYSSVKRGAYALSAQTTQKFEEARSKIAKFLDAPSENSIIFTKGTTESINLVAWSYGLANFEPEDEILLSVLEHHANIVPWQIAGKERGVKIKAIPCDSNGDLQISELQNLLSKKTKMVALTHTANSIGTINPLQEIIPVIRKFAPQAKILIDAAQGAPHSKISVKDLDCDFLAFSGHKIYGPTGVGVLYGKSEVLGRMPPWQGGGEMIDKVSFEGTTFAVPPARFEAGTPPIAEVLGLSAAIDFVNEIGIDSILSHEKQITDYALEELKKIDGLQIIGSPKKRGSIVSFVLGQASAIIHPHDVALILDEEGIAVRAGHHCAQPTMEHFGVIATLRASFAVYTESWEIDRLCQALKRAVSIFSTFPL
jgi:cysteine desulfurase/selenocysteine lyase